MSDIEYLAIKEFEGKVSHDEGTVEGPSTGDDLATLTAGSGKDMYLATAKCNIYTTAGGNATGLGEVALMINGVIVETCEFRFVYDAGTPNGQSLGNYEFKSMGHKVDATQIIKLRVISSSTPVDCRGEVTCFEEDDGVSPAIS